MVKLCLLAGCILFSSASFSLSLNQQRTIYSQAQVLQDEQRWDEAVEKLNMIPDYPLNYILEYNKLSKHFSPEIQPQVSAFVARNGERKLTDTLQREYLYYLGNNKYWDEFIRFYPRLPNSTKLKCYYFQAKISQGQGKSVWPDAEKVWLSGNSQPEQCDAVFEYYKTQDVIDQALIWQRFKLAYNKNKKSLMRYLSTLLTGDKKQLAEQLYSLNAEPQKLDSSALFNSRKNESYEFLIASMKRLARVDIDRAVQTYQSYDDKLPFSFNDGVELKKYFVFRILINNQTQLLPWADSVLPGLGDVKLVEQRLRYAIKYNDWAGIDYWIDQLPEDIAQGHTWVYWKARVLEEKNQLKQARELYKQIAGERKYYSFLAAQKLGLDYHLNANNVVRDVTSLRYLQGNLDHIEELLFHQYQLLVKREWEALLKGRDRDIQRQLGLYAYDKKWSHLSVLASIRSKSWSAINIRFPEVQRELFNQKSEKYNLPTAYLYAITRQESALDQYANSPAGARGYMQLMPATAKETARKVSLSDYSNKSQLSDPSINVELGSAYFRQLLTRYEGNRILATAAYNAGPHRVDRWKQNEKGRAVEPLQMDSWIEAIPYKETRGYVKNVLSYNMIYQNVLQQPMVFFNGTELAAKY